MRLIEHNMQRIRRRLPVIFAAAFGVLGLSGCAETQFLVNTAKRLSPHDDSTTAGKYKVGNPYQISGVWYYPKVDYDYVESGIASWYGPNFHGKKTANGETFDANIVSAAHRTLPLPSLVRVTNLDNGRSIRVRVNDRGPFAHGRIIDLSRQASQLLGFYRQGTARVRVEILAQESRQLAAAAGGENTQLARAASTSDADKPAITAAPSSTITRETLDGVPAQTPARAPTERVARKNEPESGARVTRVPVESTNIYIQAGAFADFDNANRLRARLGQLGTANVSQVQVGDQLLFRVRIGPVNNLAAADSLLERVIGAGYSNAQLIVAR